MIVYSFDLATNAEKVDPLLAVLASLDERLKPVPGYIGSTLLQFAERSHVFRLEERWESKEDHDSATDALPPELLAAVFANLTEPATPVRLEVVAR